MDEMELMMHLHLNNERQGPGSEATTLLALQLAQIDRNRSYKIADIGCGTGAQTLTLAQSLQGEILAVDLFPEFLTKLEERLQSQTLTASVTPICASMDQLPFETGTLDLIWSEGAVYNMGFQKGVTYWKDFSKKRRPTGCFRNFMDHQPAPQRIGRVLERRISRNGYRFGENKGSGGCGLQGLGTFHAA